MSNAAEVVSACAVFAQMLAATLLLAGICEWEHYRKHIRLHWMRGTKADRVILFLILWGKSLWLLLPVAVAATAAAWFGFATAAYILGAGVGGFLVAWLYVDVQVQKATGNHSLTYLSFLTDANAGLFAGGVLGLAARITAVVMLFLAGSAASLWGIEAALRGLDLSAGAAQAVFAGIAAAWAGVMLGASTICRLVSVPMIIERIHAALPCHVPGLAQAVGKARGNDAASRNLDRALQTEFAAWHRKWSAARPVDRLALPPGSSRPDVVMIVLESFRHDSITPDAMPKLHAWAQRGLQLRRHYAGTNASHFGLFSLLYGRSALVYHPTLDAGIRPQLCETLRLSGYRNSFLSSADITWKRMEEFLNVDTFDEMVIETGGGWNADDVRLFDHVLRRLENRETRRPAMQVVFPMSTHYPYLYPPEFECYLPVMPAGQVTKATRDDLPRVLNRYRNTLGFVDAELDRFLRSIDLSTTVVVVTGDHGESIFDDGFIAHYSRLSEAQTRAPLLLLGAGVPAGAIATATTHADVCPTLLHALAGEACLPRSCHGRDLLAGPVDDQAWLCSSISNRPWDALLVRDEQRLRLEISMHPPRLRVLGPADEFGNVDPRQALPDAAATNWSQWVGAEWNRMVA